MWLVRLSMGDAAAGNVALERRAGVCVNLSNVQLLAVQLLVVHRVGDGAVEHLQHNGGSGLGGVGQNRGGFVHILATDQVDNDLHLARRDANVLSNSLRTLVGGRLTSLRLRLRTGCHIVSLLSYLRAVALSPA